MKDYCKICPICKIKLQQYDNNSTGATITRWYCSNCGLIQNYMDRSNYRLVDEYRAIDSS